MFATGAVSPWLTMVDHAKFGASVDRVQSLDISTVAACHTPVLEGMFLEQAFKQVRQYPSLTAPPLPDHGVLEAILAAIAGGQLPH